MIENTYENEGLYPTPCDTCGAPPGEPCADGCVWHTDNFLSECRYCGAASTEPCEPGCSDGHPHYFTDSFIGGNGLGLESRI